jgi:transcriptional regulator with XRE-family HTH domain
MGKGISRTYKDTKEGEEVRAIMDTEKWFNDKLAALKDDADFRLETIILDLTEQISERMREKRMTRAKLAEVLGVTPAAVTKLLNGNPNFTLKTLLKVADVLGLEFTVSLGAKTPVSKPALIYHFREAKQKQGVFIPTANDVANLNEPEKDLVSWNSDDSTTGPRYGGSLSC